ncbi:hypothetical protein CBS101457_006362 [Exobasidium rhododendri]|nr:hypothetical protein CBS101457_006362 [Exobasidium rhododendri]
MLVPSSVGRLLALTAALSLPLAVDARHFLQARAQAYVDPRTNGGAMLTQTDASSGGLGEPLNVIISGESDAAVLANPEEYLESLYFSPGSCAGISLGGPQLANLGDGNGYKNQSDVMRFNYYQGDGGTCLESLYGGNHLRWFQQNGSSADTGAIFMAVSFEYNASLAHDIQINGYDLGRNLLVGNATNATTTSPGGFVYTATNTSAALLSGTSADQLNHDIAIDGKVAILTVKVQKTGVVGANRDSGTSGGTASSSGTSGGSTSSGAALTLPVYPAVAAGLAAMAGGVALLL